MKKFYLCKLCFIVFGALLAVQSVSAGNWNKKNEAVNELGVAFPVESKNSVVIETNPTTLLSFFPHVYAEIPETNHLVVSLYASEDISGDGDYEIFGMIAVIDEDDKHHTSIPARPFVLVWDETNKALQVSQEWAEALPKMIFARRFETFYGEGNKGNDLFIADYGVDGFSPKHPNCGGQNRWFLVRGEEIIDKTDELPQINDLTHDLIVEDLNQDGRADVVVINDPIPGYSKVDDCDDREIIEESYLLLSSANGFKKYKFRDIGISQKHLYLSGAVRTNQDGSFDLVMSRDSEISAGGVDIYNFVVLDDGLQLFDETNLPLGGVNLGADIRKGDIDGNDVDEFIVSNTASTDWRGHKLFVVSDRTDQWSLSKLFFEDKLHDNLGKNDQGWCGRMFLDDIDGNSSIDYVCANLTKIPHLRRSPIVARHDQNYFPVDITNAEVRQIVPFQTQSEYMLVGTKYGKQNENNVMVEWRFRGVLIDKVLEPPSN